MSTVSLGIDCSTQSMTGVAVDAESGSVVWKKSLSYQSDSRLGGFGLEHDTFVVPPRVEGEADQPPKLFLAALDALLSDMKEEGIVRPDSVAAINVSGQQHGHVYLKSGAQKSFSTLREKGIGAEAGDLVHRLADIFSYKAAPIWKTSDTAAQAEAIRTGVGGKQRMIELSGSDSPLRFSGAVMRRVAQRYPDVWEKTETVLLISSFIPAVLVGNSRVGTDFGNGCGTSLLDYQRRSWSPELIDAASASLPGGSEAFRAKLTDVVAPDAVVGSVAAYFVERYGLSPDCIVAAGSGDNPQTKVLVDGDLLSLGTSFVSMVAASTSGDGRVAMDQAGYANAMYDGLGRPFLFGCRTNGALVWDRVRMMHGLKKDEYAPADDLLPSIPVGKYLLIWQPDAESFPAGGAIVDPVRNTGQAASLEADYAGIIDTTLTIIEHYSRSFSRDTDEPLYVTGGPAGAAGVVSRIAAVWNRPVVTIGRLGAGLGAAVAGVAALSSLRRGLPSADELAAAVLPRGEVVRPEAEMVRALHGESGFARRVIGRYESVLQGFSA
jgi:xylulokinase